MKLDDLLIEKELSKLVNELNIIESQLDIDASLVAIEKCIDVNRRFFIGLMKLPQGTREAAFDKYIYGISPKLVNHMRNGTPCGKELLKFKSRVDKSSDLDLILGDGFDKLLEPIKTPMDSKHLPKCSIEKLRNSVEFIVGNIDKMMKYLVKKGHLSHPEVKRAIQDLYTSRNGMKTLALSESSISNLSDCGGNVKFKLLEQLKLIKIGLLKIIAALKVKGQTGHVDPNIRQAAIDDSKKIASITKSL